VSAGIAMGMGICSMHYVGMAAIEIAPPIRYDFLWVAASFAIAMAASFARLRGGVYLARGRLVAAITRRSGAVGMGFAISGMHYAGMIAPAPRATSRAAAATWVSKACSPGR